MLKDETWIDAWRHQPYNLKTFGLGVGGLSFIAGTVLTQPVVANRGQLSCGES
jgi:hypothetical protein